jgi:protein phosphatase
VDLESGDVILLCSDGLSDMLADEQIVAILMAELDPEQAARRLVAGANEQGGKDNVTAVVARIESI